MKTFKVIQIGLIVMLFSSCIQEVAPEGERISGMWAYVNNQSQTERLLEFKDGYLTPFSASGYRTVADGYIWHSSESDFEEATFGSPVGFPGYDNKYEYKISRFSYLYTRNIGCSAWNIIKNIPENEKEQDWEIVQ